MSELMTDPQFEQLNEEVNIDQLIENKVGLLPEIDEHEHIVDTENPEIKKAIEQSRSIFDEFVREYGQKFDLSDEVSVEEVLKIAEEKGIFGKAEKIRQLIFNKNISIYGVCYATNECAGRCPYCPMSKTNEIIGAMTIELGELALQLQRNPDDQDLQEKVKQKEQELEAFKEKHIKTLSKEELDADLGALVQIGHQEVCLLAGEALGNRIDRLGEIAAQAANTPGVKEVILNTGAYTKEQFDAIMEDFKNNLKNPDVKFQFRIFQETYDPELYARLHADSKGKGTYEKRRNTQMAALEAGFDEVGIGALIGIGKNPLLEIDGLKKHAEEIKERYNKEVKRCCLPFANEPEESHVEIDYKIPGRKNADKIIELVYALSRLAMPTVSIVSSERDEPEMLKKLDRYANHTTLFVHPAPSGNIASLEDLKNKNVVRTEITPQAEVYERFPDDAIQSWLEDGYNVVDFDWQKYIEESAEQV